MWTEQSRGRMAKIARKTKRYPSDLPDEEWEQIAPLMPKPGRRGRPREVDFREVINAVRYLVRSGGGWRMLPIHFGPWQTVVRRRGINLSERRHLDLVTTLPPRGSGLERDARRGCGDSDDRSGTRAGVNDQGNPLGGELVDRISFGVLQLGKLARRINAAHAATGAKGEELHSVHGEQPMSSTAIYIVVDDYGRQTRYGPYATMQEAEAVRAEFLAKRVAARIIEVEEED